MSKYVIPKISREICKENTYNLFLYSSRFFKMQRLEWLCKCWRYQEASTSGHDIAVYKVDPSPLEGKMVSLDCKPDIQFRCICDLLQVRRKLWPACLPDINQHYLRPDLKSFKHSQLLNNNTYYARLAHVEICRETTYVAGWGITKTKFIHGSKIQVNWLALLWDF